MAAEPGALLWDVSLAAALDPDALLRTRYKQMAQLARYGRQSVLQWGDVEVPEFLEHYRALAQLLDDEAAAGAAHTEDR